MAHECKYFNEYTNARSHHPEFQCIDCKETWYKIKRIPNYEYELINGELIKTNPADHYMLRVKDYVILLITFIE